MVKMTPIPNITNDTGTPLRVRKVIKKDMTESVVSANIDCVSQLNCILDEFTINIVFRQVFLYSRSCLIGAKSYL